MLRFSTFLLCYSIAFSGISETFTVTDIKFGGVWDWNLAVKSRQETELEILGSTVDIVSFNTNLTMSASIGWKGIFQQTTNSNKSDL